MMHHPEVMRKAQAEIDAVVGRVRTPRFEDRDNLPYIRAIVRETLRWRPPGPLGRYMLGALGISRTDIHSAAPHMATEVSNKASMVDGTMIQHYTGRLVRGILDP